MSDSLGDAAQVRKISQQLFDTWKAEQRLEDKERRRWFGGSVGGWLASAAILIGAIAAGANTYDLAVDANARSIRNEHSIGVMKVENSDRLGRIETKIDIMLEERRQ